MGQRPTPTIHKDTYLHFQNNKIIQTQIRQHHTYCIHIHLHSFVSNQPRNPTYIFSVLITKVLHLTFTKSTCIYPLYNTPHREVPLIAFPFYYSEVDVYQINRHSNNTSHTHPTITEKYHFVFNYSTTKYPNTLVFLQSLAAAIHTTIHTTAY